VQRRRALAAFGATGAAALTGCLGRLGRGSDFDPDGDEPTVDAPGETTISIRADDVTSLQVQSHCDDSRVHFDIMDATVRPQPGATYQTHPPTWTWERPRTATVHVPIDVPVTANPGSCQYDVAAKEGDGEDVESSFTITVEGE
jgi:hypothetical protein